MKSVPRFSPKPRRRFIAALLATTAMATLLGGCNQTGLLGSKDGGLSAADAKFADASDPEAAAAATTQWALAYARKPSDPRMAVGYAQALRATGEKDQALQVLQAAYQANPEDGQLAAALGRIALETGRLDIANYTLRVAESKGVSDWKTLSAQGTLRAKLGQHQQAQQYFLAALKEQPDAVPVINNLALSYAADGKPDKAEDLLRKAVASGNGDSRVRQNLALVLGLEGKFGEAKAIASADLPPADAQANVAYLRDMVNAKTAIASADDGKSGGDDWQPFGSASTAKPAPTHNATAEASPLNTKAVKPAAISAAQPQSFKTALAAETSPQSAKRGEPVTITPESFKTVVKPEPASSASADNKPWAASAQKTGGKEETKPGPVSLVKADTD